MTVLGMGNKYYAFSQIRCYYCHDNRKVTIIYAPIMISEEDDDDDDDNDNDNDDNYNDDKETKGNYCSYGRLYCMITVVMITVDSHGGGKLTQ